MRRVIACIGLIVMACNWLSLVDAAEPEKEPIAYVGHGALFDADGHELALTPELVSKIQNWYLTRLTAKSASGRRNEFDKVLRGLKQNLPLSPQDNLLASQSAIVWFAETSPATSVDPKTLGKLRALEYRLRLAPTPKVTLLNFRAAALPNVELQRRISSLKSSIATKTMAAIPGTGNSGKAYVDECSAAGVPIPPPIGKMDPAGKSGWKSVGFINRNDQFIVGTPAEVRTFESDAGFCYALPRYSEDSKEEVALDGVICLGKETANVCVWDNQMNGQTFSFPSGTQVPIGYVDTAVNPDGLYQAGGAELEGGAGGVCTDCHAGENPFVIHPKVELAPGITWGSVQDLLPAFGKDRYVPLVPASWPLNSASAPDNLVPDACGSCHEKENAGRFPALSKQLNGYCGTIFAQALERTMPPRRPGSQVGQAEVLAFQELCKNP